MSLTNSPVPRGGGQERVWRGQMLPAPLKETLAGYRYCGVCLPPHFPHWCGDGLASTRWLRLSSRCRSLLRSLISISLLVVASDSICSEVASSALHMSTAPSSMGSVFFSNLLHVWLPHTIRSLIKLSVRVPNSHDLALLRRSVTYWSPGC